MEPMKILFTSYRESIGMDGLKLSLDRRAPKLCSYPTLSYLVIPMAKNLSVANIKRICNVILDNNWNLLQDFINEMYKMGLRQLIFCDWSTKEQIEHGKFCFANVIGDYIMSKAMYGTGAFEFMLEINYGDGREAL